MEDVCNIYLNGGEIGRGLFEGLLEVFVEDGIVRKGSIIFWKLYE